MKHQHKWQRKSPKNWGQNVWREREAAVSMHTMPQPPPAPCQQRKIKPRNIPTRAPLTLIHFKEDTPWNRRTYCKCMYRPAAAAVLTTDRSLRWFELRHSHFYCNFSVIVIVEHTSTLCARSANAPVQQLFSRPPGLSWELSWELQFASTLPRTSTQVILTPTNPSSLAAVLINLTTK